MKAQTLPEVIRAFDTRPLAGQELKEWFIDRPGNPMEEMKIYPQGLALADMPVKLLFTGHSGCGKSTVLNKLAEEIKKQLLLLRWRYDNEFLGLTEWRGGCPLCPRTALACSQVRCRITLDHGQRSYGSQAVELKAQIRSIL